MFYGKCVEIFKNQEAFSFYMDIHYMTLEGEINKEKFVKQWAESKDRDATFLQSESGAYIMPYGAHSCISPEEEKVKFAGTHRRHHFVKRDFEITDQIFGGGYLKIAEDKKSCTLAYPSNDYGEAPDADKITELANELFF